MNLPDDYEPSQPVEDRRAQYLRGSGRMEQRVRGAQTLLDLMLMTPPQPYQGAPIGPSASGLADTLGYNTVGRRPVQASPYQMLPTDAPNYSLHPGFIGGSGGPIRY